MDSTRAKRLFKKISIIFTAAVIGISSLLFISADNVDFEIVKNLDIFYSLYKELDLFYVDEIDPGKTIKKGIDEMLESLDPYTVYIPESKVEDLTFMTTGQYGGIGALIRKTEAGVMIAQPYRGFPADKAGLKHGDVLREIDGKDIEGLDVEQVSELLKGQPGTKLEIDFYRPVADKELNIKLERERVKINSVPYYGTIGTHTGYIRLGSFTNTASSEVKKAMKDLKNSQDINTLVLDLRSNPGGLLVEAVKICNLFVGQGQEVVSTKGKVKKWNKTYKTSRPAYDSIIPLVVLINSRSASASEIVSGCIQDLDRGIVIGQRSFGKGLVQTTRELSYNAKLKVTTAKYYIPSGRCIQALDYAHRNEDGSVGRIPDSIISEFETHNGRKVYDGGGIKPDIELEPEKASKISSSLIQKNLISKYANKYAYTHDSISAPRDFELSNADYEDFKNSIKDKPFDYETKSESTLKELIEVSKKEKYYPLAKEGFEELKNSLAHDKMKDLQTFEDEIRELLSKEIVERYDYRSGAIAKSLEYDAIIDTSLSVLKDSSRYRGILSGKIDTSDKSKTSN